jgi:hypothetical protein
MTSTRHHALVGIRSIGPDGKGRHLARGCETKGCRDLPGEQAMLAARQQDETGILKTARRHVHHAYH